MSSQTCRPGEAEYRTMTATGFSKPMCRKTYRYVLVREDDFTPSMMEFVKLDHARAQADEAAAEGRQLTCVLDTKTDRIVYGGDVRAHWTRKAEKEEQHAESALARAQMYRQRAYDKFIQR